jgi:hypothetical protein
MRIQIFFCICLALHQKASRTYKKSESPKLKIRGANLQIGKGHRRKSTHEEPIHACHSSATGCLEDNLKPLIQNAILSERQLTPKKSQLMSSLGIPPELIQELEKMLKASESDEENTKALVNTLDTLFGTYWPGRSILGKTEFEERCHTTTALPKSLNLYIDGGVEKCVRSYIATHIFKQCMKGDITPRVACKKYTLAVRDHFDKKLKRLQRTIDSFNNFTLMGEKLLVIEEQYRAQQGLPPPTLRAYKKTLRRIARRWSLFSNENRHSKKYFMGISQRHITRRKFSSPIRLEWLDRMQSLRSCRVNPENLKKEWAEQRKFYENQFNYCLEEFSGTKEPDYRYLTGLLSPTSGKIREATEKEEREIGDKMLKRKLIFVG